MRKWLGIPLSFLFVLGLFVPAWANSELTPGGRLFFPLWDVSTPNRLTFIVVTREALNETQTIKSRLTGTADGAVAKKIWYLQGTGNCIPRGVNALLVAPKKGPAVSTERIWGEPVSRQRRQKASLSMTSTSSITASPATARMRPCI